MDFHENWPVFVRYKRSKELSLKTRAFDFTKIKTLKNCVTSAIYT